METSKKRIRKLFTEEEDKYITKIVSENPENLRRTFEMIAVKLSRNPICVKNRWYSYLSKQTNNKRNVSFALFSKSKLFKNHKNDLRGTKATKTHPVKSNKSKWKRILAILAE